MTTQQKVILVTGLTMPASKALAPDMDEVSFGQNLEKSISTLSSIPEVTVHRFDLDHRPDAAPEASLEAFKKVVRERQYDAHIIGAGLKKIPPLLPLFETLVNEMIVSSGGKAKLLFSGTGSDHVEVVKRGFPELR